MKVPVIKTAHRVKESIALLSVWLVSATKMAPKVTPARVEKTNGRIGPRWCVNAIYVVATLQMAKANPKIQTTTNRALRAMIFSLLGLSKEHFKII